MPASAKPVLSLAASLLLAGCAGGAEQLQLGITGALPSLPTLPTFIEAGHPGKPSDVYARVARGMLVCWFAGPAGMRRTHIFSGDVPPPDKGEKAEIVVHERDAAANPRGLAALRVSFSPRSEGRTDMVVATPRFIGAQGQAMQATIERWAAGDPACDHADNAAWSTGEKMPPSKLRPAKAKGGAKGKEKGGVERKATSRTVPAGGKAPTVVPKPPPQPKASNQSLPGVTPT